jgi:hypothetical protein
MAVFNKINSFVADIANGVHNLSTGSLKVALTDSAPVATNTVLANITEISYTNLSARLLTVTSSTQTSGTYKLIVANITLSASGTVPQFRYAVIYDDSASSKQLIGWVDYGSELNMASGDVINVTFDASNGLIQLA